MNNKNGSFKLLPLLFILILVSCSDDDSDPKTPEIVKERGSWSQYWPEYVHDGNPLESENFIVFSEAASTNSRQEVANLAEQYLLDVKTLLQVSKEDFDFIPNWGSEKIHVMADYNQTKIWGLAYRDGVIIRSKDSPNFNGDHSLWQKVVQHEITHVVEFLLIGDFAHRQSNSVWFREGFGNYGARNHAVQNVQQLEEWKTSQQNIQGGGNPISILVWNNFPQSVRDQNKTGEYYKFFELSVRYLLDEENGNGTSLNDVKAFYEDLGKGITFKTAFNQHFGMTVSEFENHWWELMEEYLKSK